MKKMLALFGAAAALLLAANTTAFAHDDEDGVTQIDHHYDADVIHYDHHHRQLVTDEYGNVVGERTIHHDHHYVAPRSDSYVSERSYYPRYEHSRYNNYGYDGRRYRRHQSRVSFFFGGW
ncbi:MAG: hypothetical protein ABR526_13720 [Chthoniobacterales bacterium]